MATLNEFSRSRGFSLIEAMLAVVILATGLLAIARFQSGLVTSSGASKARAEAIALAQEKIDQIRSYEDFQEFASNLNPDLAVDASTNYTDIVTDTAVPDTPIAVVGTNSDFALQWAVTANATTRAVDVSVSWTDPRTNDPESVTLSTEVAWADPSLSAEAETLDDFLPAVPSPTGTAVYGDETRDLDTITGETLNDDGETYTYANPDTGDVELLNLDGAVLLKLEDACNNTDGVNIVCTDFVRIKGLVWIDDSTVNSVDTSNVTIQASDTAFCSKSYSRTVTTANSRFRYFPYTCYLGGTWNGNISVVQYEGAASSRGDVCVGDPITASGAGVDSPKIAVRRVYRGMISVDEHDNSDYSSDGRDLIVDDSNGDGIGTYASAGIADALTLPNPDNTDINANYNLGFYDQADPSQNLYLPGHNYLITNLPGATPDDSDCLTPMTDADAVLTLTDGSLTTNVNAFTKTPDDFQCFNAVLDSGLDASGNTTRVPYFNPDDYRIETGYLEANGDQILLTKTNDGTSFYYYIGSTQAGDASGNPSSTNILSTVPAKFMDMIGCPYDPSDPPSEVDFVRGSIYSTDASPVLVAGMVVNTSDDVTVGVAGNCEVQPRAAVGSATRGTFSSEYVADPTADSSPANNPGVSTVIADYVCKVYHDYDGSDTSLGWTGNVVITPANLYGCSPASYAYPEGSELIADTGSQTGATGTLDFNCQYIGPSGADLVVEHTLTSGDSSPLEGALVTFQTTVTNNGLANATNVSLNSDVPTGLTYVGGTGATSVTAGTAGVSTTAGSWDDSTGDWTGINLLDGDQVTLVWSATVDAGQLGNQITSSVTGFTADQTDSNVTPDDTQESIIVTTAGTANLVYDVSLTSGNSTPGEGEDIEFTVTVTNLGGGTATNIDFPITVPANSNTGASNELDNPYSITESHGTYAAGTWTVGDLPDASGNTSATLVIKGTGADGGDQPTVTITGTDVTPTLTDPNTINDDYTESVTVQADVADLVTVMSVSNNAPSEATNEEVTVTIVVTNNGPNTAHNIQVDTFIPANVDGVTYKPSSSNDITWIDSTGVWRDDSSFDLASGASRTLTFIVTVDSGASIYSPITLTTSAADENGTGGNITFDNTSAGDVLSQVLTIGSSGTFVMISGDINYTNTTNEVTAVEIYAVDALATHPGTMGSCTFSAGTAPGTPGSYSCNVTIDPSDSNGVYLLFTHADTVCNYNAKEQSGVLITTGSDLLYWIDSTTLGAIDTASVDIDARNTSGGPANQCP